MRLRFFILIIVLLFYGLPVKADFISLIRADQCETIIEVYIEDDRIRVTYEIGLNDWKYFKEIIPKDLLNEEILEYIQSQDENHFFNQVFSINADGKNLLGDIVQQEVMPKKVVITPPMEEGLKGTRANIGFVTYHKNIPVNDLRYLSQPSTLNLNWDDPWFSRYDNINLRRHHQSSLMSFLYVDPYEVRHEVLVRVKDLEEWLNLEYELDDTIEVEEQDTLKEKISAFLSKA